MMGLSFPTVKLGKYIKEVKCKVKNTDLKQSELIVYGVTNTEGITVTNNKASDDIGNYTILSENQFAYNPYRVNVGSIGLSSHGTFGVVSPAYVVFETTEEISSEFLLYYLKSNLGINLIKWYGNRGGVRSALRFADLKKIDFPDIDLEKQIYILEKVKQIDDKLSEFNKNLSLENISALRQAILQQAIEGKLCKQDPTDEPASVLLEKIKAEKEKLIAEKKIKKQKELPPITEEEKLFELPQGWEWCRFGELLKDLKYGTAIPCDYNSINSPVLRIPNINTTDNSLDLNDLKYGALKETEILEYELKKDDILLIRSNGSASLVGRIALVDNIEARFCYAGYLIRLRTFKPVIDNMYLIKVFNSKYLRQLIEIPIRTTTGVKNINSTEVTNLLIPLPPITEQKRIVEKVDRLMALCNELEQEVINTKKYASQLMEAVLQESFSRKEEKYQENIINFVQISKPTEQSLLAAARGNMREETWENLRTRALELASEEI